MKTIAAALAAALFASAPGKSLDDPKSLAEHEAIAATLSYKDAVVRQNELFTAGETYNLVPYTRRAYDLIAEAAAKNPSYRDSYYGLALHFGDVLINARQHDEATLVLKKLVGELEDVYGSDGIQLIIPLMSLGKAQLQYLQNGSINNRYFVRAVEIARKHKGDNDPLVGKLYFQMSQASLVNASGDWRKANRKLQKSHEILLEQLGAGHQDVAMSAYRIGELAVIRKKYSEAADYLEDAARVFDTQHPNHRITQRMHELLVTTYENLGDSDSATKHCQMVGRIKEANGDAEKTGLGYTPIHIQHPRYPRAAQERGQEGSVVVELTVTDEGKAGDVRILSTEGHRSFAKAAVKAAEQFRYAARYENGAPVDTKGVRYRFTFNLAN